MDGQHGLLPGTRAGGDLRHRREEYPHGPTGLPREGRPFLRVEGHRLPDRKHSLATQCPGKAHWRYSKSTRNCNAFYMDRKNKIFENLVFLSASRQKYVEHALFVASCLLVVLPCGNAIAW